MAQRHHLDAEARTIHGKDNRKLRRDGVVPGVIYGPVIDDPISVSVDMKELDRMYYAYGSNLLIDLKLDSEQFTVYMRRVTMDRLKRHPLHAEFYAPNMRTAITASIQVHLVGAPASDSGVVTPVRETVDIRGLPDALPPSIEVDISSLAEYDDAIYLREIETPEGVELLTDVEEMLVKLTAPARIEPTAEEIEAAEAAEVDASAEDADSEDSAETADGEESES